MNPSASRAALARLQALPWADYRATAVRLLLLLWTLARSTAEFFWQHRAEIATGARFWAARTADAALVAAWLAFEAGAATRRAWEASLAWGRHAIAVCAELLPSRPIPAAIPLEALSVAELRTRLEAHRWPGLAWIRRIVAGEV